MPKYIQKPNHIYITNSLKFQHIIAFLRIKKYYIYTVNYFALSKVGWIWHLTIYIIIYTKYKVYNSYAFSATSEKINLNGIEYSTQEITNNDNNTLLDCNIIVENGIGVELFYYTIAV